MENARLKESLERLQKAVALGQGGNEEITSKNCTIELGLVFV